MLHSSTDALKESGVMKWVSCNALCDAVTQHLFLLHNSNVTQCAHTQHCCHTTLVSHNNDTCHTTLYSLSGCHTMYAAAQNCCHIISYFL